MITENDLTITVPGRIVEYFPENQTATVVISSEIYYDNSERLDEVTTRSKLHNVPVHTPFGGGWSVTFPIKKGDSCLLMFSQFGYDHWLYKDLDEAGGTSGRPSTWLEREFSEKDGFALVGFNTLPRAIQSYSGTASQWRNTDASQCISLNDDNSIDITTTAHVTINCSAVTVNTEVAEINATASTTVNTGTAEINASTSAKIISPTTTIDGNCDVTGNLTAGGILVNGHDHVAGIPPGSTGPMK